jgi:hypothetical protein
MSVSFILTAPIINIPCIITKIQPKMQPAEIKSGQHWGQVLKLENISIIERGVLLSNATFAPAIGASDSALFTVS